MPEVARVQICLGGAKLSSRKPVRPSPALEPEKPNLGADVSPVRLEKRVERVGEFNRRLLAARLGESYEAAHARLILDCTQAATARQELLRTGKIHLLPEASQIAADKSYLETVTKLCDGLESVMKSYESSPNSAHKRILQLWREGGETR